MNTPSNLDNPAHSNAPATPTWEIARLIQASIGPGRQARQAFPRRLRYANNGTAAKRLDRAKATGNVSRDLMDRLPEALGVHADVVMEAIARTRGEQARHEAECRAWAGQVARRKFKPHITVQVDPARRRMPIFILALCTPRRARTIEVQRWLPRAPLAVQLSQARSLIQAHQRGPDGARCRDFFGDPTSYIYYPSYSESWLFTDAADPVGRMDRPETRDTIELRLGRKIMFPGGIHG